MKVLIVEDHAIFRRMIRNMLDRDWTVLEAGNGEEALERVKESRDVEIILADYNMPKMNGLTMIERLRSDFPDLTPRIIFISSERDKTLAARASALGIVDWLPKPFKKEDLLAILKKGS